MGQFIYRRFISIIPTVFVIITLGFFIIRVAPGGPFSREKAVPPAVLANLMAKYNMDEPLVMQYLHYLGGVLTGDLGPSFTNKDFSVNELIASGLPNSITLGLTAISIALLFGVLAGVISALKQNTAADYTAMSFAVTGISVPTFVIGPVLMLIFAIWFKLLPTSGWIDGRHGMKTIIMPAITLAFPQFAYIARLMRASMLETLRSDYVRTARAKGLSMPVIIFKHVLKGACLPVVSYLGPAMAALVTGSVVVERIFAIPGIGMHFVRSATNRDYTMIMGTVIVYSLILIALNFIVDIIYGFLDPRISYK
uniref:Oligopeptide transport system permease protein OppB (TC 3.A.1.5.1) n=1 Tax=uncultured bacterium contig00066 TaxID=1181548 RepID=A0A806KB80_9BACT|nr:oligopeptide transport system permease protein OppB (TC 3.A.1.5.1) [uncultured bacterium contig00066]